MNENKPVSVGDWIITFILLGIPVVNLIMLIYWAVSSTTNPSKQNYARAALIIGAVVIVLAIIIGVIGGLAGLGASSYQSR